MESLFAKILTNRITLPNKECIPLHRIKNDEFTLYNKLIFKYPLLSIMRTLEYKQYSLFVYWYGIYKMNEFKQNYWDSSLN